MPTDGPKMTKPTRRPWWVAPGLGAVLGAAVIAVAAQGSLAAGPVELPTGPRLATSPVSPKRVSAVVSHAATVVAPVHAVVTEATPAAAAGTTFYGSSDAGGPSGSADAAGIPAGSGSPAPAGPPGGTSDTTEVPTTSPETTTPTTPPTTTTTTSTEHEPKDE